MNSKDTENLDRYERTMLEIINFCEERDWAQFHNPKDLAVALSIEGIELVEIFRWKTAQQAEELILTEPARTQVEHEIADIAFFLFLFCKKNNIDIWEALSQKMKLNSEKYPVDRVKGQSKKYNEYSEYRESDSLPGNKS